MKIPYISWSMTSQTFFSNSLDKIELFNEFVYQYSLEDIIISDHFGYKCSSAKEFEILRHMLEISARFVYQSIISERRIAIIKLVEPIKTHCGDLCYFELADQKPDNSQKGGFDHLEFFPKIGTVENLVSALRDQGVAVTKSERPHHVTYDIKVSEDFKLRIETESLLSKIVREEIKIM